MSKAVRAHSVTLGKEQLYLVLSSLPSSKPQKLFVLPWNEVDCCIFQQSSKDKEKTHSHPNVNSFYIGDLKRNRNTACYSSNYFLSWRYRREKNKHLFEQYDFHEVGFPCSVFWFVNLLTDKKYIIQLLMKMSVHKECRNELLPLGKDQDYFNKIQVSL